jgi:hypothetical protein
VQVFLQYRWTVDEAGRNHLELGDAERLYSSGFQLWAGDQQHVRVLAKRFRLVNAGYTESVSHNFSLELQPAPSPPPLFADVNDNGQQQQQAQQGCEL